MPRLPPFLQHLQEYIKDCQNRFLSEVTIYQYDNKCRRAWKFGKEHGWPGDPKKIRPEHIRDYYKFLQSTSTSNQKVNLSVLLIYLRWCGNKHIEKMRLGITVTRSNVDWLSEEQVAAVLSSAGSPALSAALVLMSYCGMRAGEVCRLRMSDMKDRSVIIRGKGRKERRVAVDVEFWEQLEPYLRFRDTLPSSDLFLIHRSFGTNGQRSSGYSRKQLTKRVTALCRSLNLPSTCHTFRRSFGRHLYKRGCPIMELSEIMGHADPKMTKRYLGLDEYDTTEAMKFRPSYKDLQKKRTQHEEPDIKES